jgi:hypothetical protein
VKHRVLAAPLSRICAASIYVAAFAGSGCSSGGASSAPPAGAGGGTVAASGGFPGTLQGAGGGAPGGSPSATNPRSFVGVDGGIIANPPVDPTIRFDWPVDDPNPSSLSCQSGHYTGLFVGLYTSPITVVGVPIPVTGNVDLTLAQSSNGEFFTITNGFVTGRADILAEYRCNFFGTLNCTTKKLEMGRIDCKYCVGTYAADGGLCLGLESHFTGPVTADYDAANQAFDNATWKGKEAADAGVFGGFGTWTAAYTP